MNPLDQTGDCRLTIDGLEYTAYRAVMTIKMSGETVPAGSWIVEGHGRYRVMTHEHFCQEYGRAMLQAGHPVYSVGFGTPDDPRNAVPIDPNHAATMGL